MDEIGDLSLGAQVKLLRLLQEREYYPLGADRPKTANARVVVATHMGINQLSDESKFRPDLFFRLKTHHVDIPPLRERGVDIPLLLEHFMAKAATEYAKPVPTWPSELAALLKTYPFPGNVREFRAMVFDAVSRHVSKVMSLNVFRSHIEKSGMRAKAPELAKGIFSGIETLPSLREAADLLVDEAMDRSGGNQRIAASLLGISHQALNKRLMKRK